jgi:hypothetical protein
MPITNRLIRKIAEKDRIAFKKHSAIRMKERGIYADEVKKIMLHGEIIEEYPEDKPFPSCLVFGFTEKQKPVHIVIAIDSDDQIIWVITVYSPSKEEWEDGFKRRKTK